MERLQTSRFDLWSSRKRALTSIEIIRGDAAPVHMAHIESLFWFQSVTNTASISGTAHRSMATRSGG